MELFSFADDLLDIDLLDADLALLVGLGGLLVAVFVEGCSFCCCLVLAFFAIIIRSNAFWSDGGGGTGAEDPELVPAIGCDVRCRDRASADLETGAGADTAASVPTPDDEEDNDELDDREDGPAADCVRFRLDGRTIGFDGSICPDWARFDFGSSGRRFPAPT